jgi:hypothetical protein
VDTAMGVGCSPPSICPSHPESSRGSVKKAF